MDYPSVRYLLEMPETRVIPPSAQEVVRKIDNGNCYIDSPFGAYVVSRIGTNDRQSKVAAFYRRQFTHFGWAEKQNYNGDTYWEKGEFLIELSFVDPNEKNIIGGDIDTSMYQTWYILFIGNINRVESDC